MSLPKDGKPIPADLAREYLKTIAEALRAEAESDKHSPSFLHSPATGTGYRAPAFTLAADVLEAVADGRPISRPNLGHLINGTAEYSPHEKAVAEVCRQAIMAHCRGEPISKFKAFDLADEVLDSSKSKTYFYEYQRHHGHKIDLPFKGTTSPAWTRKHCDKG